MDMYLQSEELEIFITPIKEVKAENLPSAKYVGDGLWEDSEGNLYAVVG